MISTAAILPDPFARGTRVWQSTASSKEAKRACTKARLLLGKRSTILSTVWCSIRGMAG